MKVFIGAAPNGDDAESALVCEFSIRKHASQPVDITWMALSSNPRSFFYAPLWRTEEWATPFSGFRWVVPALAGFQGRAIYTDSDLIFLADIAELWNLPITPGKVVVAKSPSRFCVSLWDCAAATSCLPSIQAIRSDPGAHQKLIRQFAASNLVAPFRHGDWNVFDGEKYASLDDFRIKALHCTNIATQPGHRWAMERLPQGHWYDGPVHPHSRPDVRALFERYYDEARVTGYRVENYIPAGPRVEYRKRSLVNYRGLRHG